MEILANNKARTNCMPDSGRDALDRKVMDLAHRYV